MRLGFVLGLLLGGGGVGLRGDVVEADGKVHVTYWEKWTGFENDALQQVVARFNASQERIKVTVFATSQIDRKTIIATAGGDPPDIAGLWQRNVSTFADAGALLPLDDFIRRDGGTPKQWLERYYPVYAGMCQHAGTVYAVISTPSVSTLHWNKAHFREVGLDPERPPRTLAELDEFSRRLLRVDEATGESRRVGFLPQEPGFWNWAIPVWFGGKLFEDGEVTLGTDPAVERAFAWVAGITRELGNARLQRFVSGFGSPGSAEAAFLQGKVSMQLQGVWYHNYINQFQPGLEYGVAPWPQVPGGPVGFSVAGADVLVIPRGARNPAAGWEFLRYLAQANPAATSAEELRGAEELCYLQQKNSPLREWSPYFAGSHPHPYIGLFRELSALPGATAEPTIGMWQEYNRELGNAMERTRLLQAEPAEALGYAQERIAASWVRYRQSLERHGQRATVEATP
jgi:ABC-type glycerol-3-phosphate transport system substrate-binding protein